MKLTSLRSENGAPLTRTWDGSAFEVEVVTLLSGPPVITVYLRFVRSFERFTYRPQDEVVIEGVKFVLTKQHAKDSAWWEAYVDEPDLRKFAIVLQLIDERGGVPAWFRQASMISKT